MYPPRLPHPLVFHQLPKLPPPTKTEKKTKNAPQTQTCPSPLPPLRIFLSACSLKRTTAPTTPKTQSRPRPIPLGDSNHPASVKPSPTRALTPNRLLAAAASLHSSPAHSSLSRIPDTPPGLLPLSQSPGQPGTLTRSEALTDRDSDSSLLPRPLSSLRSPLDEPHRRTHTYTHTASSSIASSDASYSPPRCLELRSALYARARASVSREPTGPATAGR